MTERIDVNQLVTSSSRTPYLLGQVLQMLIAFVSVCHVCISAAFMTENGVFTLLLLVRSTAAIAAMGCKSGPATAGAALSTEQPPTTERRAAAAVQHAAGGSADPINPDTRDQTRKAFSQLLWKPLKGTSWRRRPGRAPEASAEMHNEKKPKKDPGLERFCYTRKVQQPPTTWHIQSSGLSIRSLFSEQFATYINQTGTLNSSTMRSSTEKATMAPA